MEENYLIPSERIAHIDCARLKRPPVLDGDLGKQEWAAAEKSGRFVDIVTGEPAFLDTRIAARWDERALYLAFWVQEPAVTASLTERDSLIWFDNDIEVFFDGEDCYYEFEMNAFGTIYEVFFVYQDAHKKGSRFDIPEFDLQTRDVDVLSGFQDAGRFRKHRRGRRWAFMDWDFPGLESRVKVDGRINDTTHLDRGWTAELAFPWDGFRTLSPGKSFPPKPGDSLRFQCFRFQALRFHGKTIPESIGWALNEHGSYDSHIPENFAVLHFRD